MIQISLCFSFLHTQVDLFVNAEFVFIDFCTPLEVKVEILNLIEIKNRPRRLDDVEVVI